MSEEENMKVGILGAGRLASILGGCWVRKGHDVVFGVRNPTTSKVVALVETLGVRARVATVPEAAGTSDIVALAVPWSSYQDAIQQAGDLSGKVLVDCSSPFKSFGAGDPNRREELEIGLTTSGAETVSSWVPGARVVLAFNGPGLEVLDNPQFGSERATMFICGDDAQAKRDVTQLANDLGFDVCDTGSLCMARYVEPMTMVWIDMSRNQKRGTDFAFKLLNRGAGLAPPETRADLIGITES